MDGLRVVWVGRVGRRRRCPGPRGGWRPTVRRARGAHMRVPRTDGARPAYGRAGPSPRLAGPRPEGGTRRIRTAVPTLGPGAAVALAAAVALTLVLTIAPARPAGPRGPRGLPASRTAGPPSVNRGTPNTPAPSPGLQPAATGAAVPEPPGGPGPAALTAAEAQLLKELLDREAAAAWRARRARGPTPGLAAPPGWWTPVVAAAARVSGLPPALIAAVIQVESEGNPGAVSPAGAEGLMQLLPSTAAELGVTNIFDPIQNADGGARYLAAWLLRYSGGEQHCVTSPQDCPYALTVALAAYNAGPSAVARYGGVPPYPETERYISLVSQLFREYQAEG